LAEIEISVLKGQRLDRRIESHDRLIIEIDARQSKRNARTDVLSVGAGRREPFWIWPCRLRVIAVP
jgi:hypothetical protein